MLQGDAMWHQPACSPSLLQWSCVQDQRQIGVTNTDPKWAIAWKPAPEEAVTTLQDVIVSVGRSGTLLLSLEVLLQSITAASGLSWCHAD